MCVSQKTPNMATNPDHVPPSTTIRLSFLPEYESVPFSPSSKLTFSGHILAPEVVNDAKRPMLSLSAVLDKSGSMGHDLGLVKRTCEFMMQQLSRNDKLGVVQYDSNVDEVIAPKQLHLWHEPCISATAHFCAAFSEDCPGVHDRFLCIPAGL